MAEPEDEVVGLLGPQWAKWLKAIGLEGPIARVIIDLDFEKGNLPRIYVSRFGTRKLMVNPPNLTGAEIVVIGDDRNSIESQPYIGMPVEVNFGGGWNPATISKLLAEPPTVEVEAISTIGNETYSGRLQWMDNVRPRKPKEADDA